MARADLDEALRFALPHLSAYQLTLEPNTRVLEQAAARCPSTIVAADMQLAAEESLRTAGYEHYETSAFARPGRRCRHNLNYWQFGDYLGIGAGAHGKLSFPDRVTRHARAKQPNEYMKPDARCRARAWSRAAELPFEFMLNALRLVEGFDAALFSERTGLPIATVEKHLMEMEAKGLLQRDWKRIRPTERGRRFLNELLEAFLPDRRAPAPASG